MSYKQTYNTFLSVGTNNSYEQGKVPLVSTSGVHQLHIFIFFLAVFHVVFSALTMTLGRLKVGINAEL